ncbi:MULTISPECIES: hypothetical protein [Aequorivita]|uniref:DUF3575 domain-containing protein n=2 Tax=Aequorivita TaxID=153265 RepID=A0AB35YR11_9FLAO|nr:hypothetical protein [Aequorivita sp. Ant34-E75]WGF93129.1 hypothetical protein QCQ61_02830 [Aequorivita sp. Ant34-E75]
MKKILFLILMSGSFIGFAQESKNFDAGPQGKHEFRLDGFEALVFKTIEINYEYVISKYSGAGAAISFNTDGETIGDYGQKFAFTPYYRQYFLNKKEYGARGLFVEGSLQLATGEHEIYYYDYNPNTDTYIEGTTKNNWFDTGIGLAIGQKWVSNNGFTFEISAGGGRYLLNDDYAPEGYFRGGILIGYRF